MPKRRIFKSIGPFGLIGPLGPIDRGTDRPIDPIDLGSVDPQGPIGPMIKKRRNSVYRTLRSIGL